jgi:hypothetical protein
MSGTEATPRVTRNGYPARELRKALQCVLVSWIFGAGFFTITSGATFTSFLTKFLKADDLSFGLVMAIGPAASIFQFVGSYFIERTGHIKWSHFYFTITHRLLWLGVAAIPLCVPLLPKHALIALAGLIAFLSAMANNLGNAGWPAWMATVVPAGIVGKFFGRRTQLGLITMLLLAPAVALLLDRSAHVGQMYCLVFVLAAVLGTVDICCFIPIRQVRIAPDPASPTMAEILTTPWRNVNFRSFAWYTLVTWFAYAMMTPFTWPFTFALGANIITATLLLSILPMIMMAAVSTIWGSVIDRIGPKPVMALGALCGILFPAGWLFVSPTTFWLIPIITIMGGLTQPGIDSITMYVQVKGFPTERHSTYIATFTVLLGLAGMGGSAVGGVFALFLQHHMARIPFAGHGMSHYIPLFATSILLRILSFVFLLPHVQLPGNARLTRVSKLLVRTTHESLVSRIQARSN